MAATTAHCPARNRVLARRNASIYNEVASGKTQTAVARKHGLTPARVNQIVRNPVSNEY